MVLLRALFFFPIFSPNPSPPPPPQLLSSTPSSHRPSTEIRFSRWNNANAEPFIRQRRTQQEIEDDLRRYRRHETASRLSELPSPSSSSPPASPSFKSHGTPSSPSAPSIPGKASKYSKAPRNPKSSDLSHPAFRSIFRRKAPQKVLVPEGEKTVVVGENGISYRFENAPFEFQYSYTETPKVKPLALREPPYLPFGPTTMPRPWTGRAPLPASKKKLPEFDSFKPPPAGKKGVKPVQNPGPFLAGSGPRYGAKSREEVLGEPLTDEEVKDMVQGCMKTNRQLNIGRDGLTHNMLDNIHALWKRRRLCKIKCKGVCTVDMDNVRQQLEEKTGGKVIYSRGGVLFLFRGRNYNYKTRPRFPLMLWKPSPPIYPRLVQRVPDGLTLEEAMEMHKRGRELPPICKLAKNGVYINLVNDVKEAFGECELVRVNCQGLNKSDCRKIGAKLKDLVPCVLVSFEFEHILMWRGKDWKSSLPPEDGFHKAVEPAATSSGVISLESADPLQVNYPNLSKSDTLTSFSKGVSFEGIDEKLVSAEEPIEDSMYQLSSAHAMSIYLDNDEAKFATGTHGIVEDLASERSLNDANSLKMVSENLSVVREEGADVHVKMETNNQVFEDVESGSSTTGIGRSFSISYDDRIHDDPESEAISTEGSLQYERGISQRPHLNAVMLLLKQAIDNGSAVILDNDSLDANIVYERAVHLAKTAPSGPVFRHQTQTKKPSKEKVAKVYSIESDHMNTKVEDGTWPKQESGERRRNNQSKDDFKEAFPAAVPHGSLKIDELAKLLA